MKQPRPYQKPLRRILGNELAFNCANKLIYNATRLCVGRSWLRQARENRNAAHAERLLQNLSDENENVPNSLVGLVTDVQDKSGQRTETYAVEAGHTKVVRLCLDNRINALRMTNAQQQGQLVSYFSELLLCVARSPCVDVVKLLLRRTTDLNLDADSALSFQTALSSATTFGHTDTAQRLINSGADVKYKDDEGRTPIFYATESGHAATVQLLIDSRSDIDPQDFNSQAPLLYGAGFGFWNAAQLLIDNGADPHYRDGYEQTALFKAAAKTKSKRLLQALMNNGVAFDSRDISDRTPLSCAAREGHHAVVRLLLDAGAAVDSADDTNRTPLSYAAEGRHKLIVRLLLDAGAAVDSRDTQRRTPLSYAAESRGAEVVKLLIEKGAEVNCQDLYRRRPLCFALGQSFLGVLRLLLERGCEVNYTSQNGTPLSSATEAGHLEAMRRLVAALVNFQDGQGRTALSFAAQQKKNARAAKLLLDEGSHWEEPDNMGRTPLYYARQGLR